MGGLEITSIHEMGFMLKDKCGFLFDTRWRKSALATSVEDMIDDIMTEIKTM